ncbi:MAG: insulinase family protein [Candidatus Pacearchaeota archaeon]|nr:insulinase family protein [Candidatus Pacearchaeota archaeon]
MVELYKALLENGITLLFEKRSLPVVAIMVATKAGAAYENEKSKGIAHFTEHMLFKGSKTRSQKEISSTIEKAGGILNGFTAEQITAYWCKMPSRHASLGAEIIFDMFSNPKFDAKELEKEKGVITSEINRKHDLPAHFLFDKVKELLYKKPFALSVLGSEKSITSFNRANFVDWHNFYGSENTIVTIVGNTDINEIEKLARKIMPCHCKIPKVNIVPLNKNQEFIEKRKDIDQAHLVLAFNAPKLSSKERYSAEIFNSILGQGMSSWLFQEVREKRGWAYTIKSFIEAEKDYGHCIVYAGIDKNNLKKVKEIILKEIMKFKDLNPRDFEEAKEQCIGNWQIDREDSEKTAAAITFQEIATKAEDFYSYDKKISEVKLQDVKDVAKIKNYVSAAVVPK